MNKYILNFWALVLLAAIFSGAVQSQKTNTLKILQSGEAESTAPLQPLKKAQYTSQLTAAAQVCVRGLHALYDKPNFGIGDPAAKLLGTIRSAQTQAACVDATPFKTAMSSRFLGNYDYSKPSVTIFQLKDFSGEALFNVSNVASAPPLLVPGSATVPFGSIVTTGTGYRYFFSTQTDFASALYVKCVDTIAITSDNRFNIPDVVTTHPTILGTEIRALSWSRSKGPPGMVATEAAKLICLMAYDNYGRHAGVAK